MLCDICNILAHDILYNILNIILNDFIHDEWAMSGHSWTSEGAHSWRSLGALCLFWWHAVGTPWAHHGHDVGELWCTHIGPNWYIQHYFGLQTHNKPFQSFWAAIETFTTGSDARKKWGRSMCSKSAFCAILGLFLHHFLSLNLRMESSWKGMNLSAEIMQNG